MAQHACPVWAGYLLLSSPFKKLLKSPRKMPGPCMSPGMTVLEPGCGMGFFTLPVAQMAGPEGLFREIQIVLKPGVRFLAVEPRGHVGTDNFAESQDSAHHTGLKTNPAEPEPVLIEPERREQ